MSRGSFCIHISEVIANARVDSGSRILASVLDGSSSATVNGKKLQVVALIGFNTGTPFSVSAINFLVRLISIRSSADRTVPLGTISPYSGWYQRCRLGNNKLHPCMFVDCLKSYSDVGHHFTTLSLRNEIQVHANRDCCIARPRRGSCLLVHQKSKTVVLHATLLPSLCNEDTYRTHTENQDETDRIGERTSESVRHRRRYETAGHDVIRFNKAIGSVEGCRRTMLWIVVNASSRNSSEKNRCASRVVANPSKVSNH